jgi:hypothetical protein
MVWGASRRVKTTRRLPDVGDRAGGLGSFATAGANLVLRMEEGFGRNVSGLDRLRQSDLVVGASTASKRSETVVG